MSDISGELGSAVEKVEESAFDTYKAACEAGDWEAAERVHAATVESLKRAASNVEDAAETVEQIAEEVAADAPKEVAEEAEQAVDSAHEAVEAAQDAQAEVREEQREAGGESVTEPTAVDQAIHEEAEEAIESAPVEATPAIQAEESFEQEIADVTSVEDAAPEPAPALIAPTADHPYYRKRRVKMFGRTFEI